jgi:transposase
MFDTEAMPQPQNGVKTARVKLPVSASPDHVPDPEVVPRAKRRRFTKKYKLRILKQVDACTQPGQIGALLRSEGLYSSNLTKWRRLREAGQLGTKKRGRPGADPSEKELARLRAENVRLAKKLEQAEVIIEVQKKLSVLLGLQSDVTEKADSK